MYVSSLQPTITLRIMKVLPRIYSDLTKKRSREGSERLFPKLRDKALRLQIGVSFKEIASNFWNEWAMNDGI